MVFESEIVRRETFRTYQATEISNFNEYVNEFAYHGFFVTKQNNNRDIVICFFCNLKCLSLCSNDTDPIGLHKKYNPMCPLVNGLPTNNIPAPENNNRGFNPINPAGIGYVARFPEYASKTKRLNSFKNWPATSRMRIDDLVYAGLFYLGQDDKVACYTCGLGLMDFEDNDLPMEEHRKYALQNCEFIKRSFQNNL